jgi:hypothetical protein
MVSADQQISVQSHHEIRNIGAHFECLTKIGNHDYLIVLNELSCEYRGAKVVTQYPITAGDWVEYKNQTIHAVEFGIGAHVLVKVLF